MSPVTYKSYLSQAKMKVLKPEITEINEKFKDNAMKIYNYCKFLTVAMDTKIAKAIVDKRKELEVHNAC